MENEMIINILVWMVLGFILLVKGADFLVKGATDIAKRFHISEMLIGILVIGIGTSLPEIIVTIESAVQGKSDIIIGNGIGSSICNILLVVGVAAICRPVSVDKRIIKVHLPISILSIIILGIVCNIGGNIITRAAGFLLLVLTSIYVIYTIYEGKKENEDNKKIIAKKKLEKSKLKIVVLIVLGIIFLKYGADLVVGGTTQIAQLLNISESIISMTIVAVGTALPEIVTSVIASINKESDLALGNVIGSNIFNILLLPGLGAIINPIQYNKSFNITLLFLLAVVILVNIVELFGKKYKISRIKGVGLTVLYILYTYRLFI